MLTLSNAASLVAYSSDRHADLRSAVNAQSANVADLTTSFADLRDVVAAQSDVIAT